MRSGVASILDDHSELVPVSQALGRHLFASQNRRNPAGLLAVGIGKTDVGEVIAILKPEREQGLRLRIEVVNGRTEVDTEFLRDLTLTDKTKIFKTSVFRLHDPGKSESIYGLVSDDQRGRDDGTGVATFFLSTFLGCQLESNPGQTTLDFAQAAERFINEDVASDERRASYQVALLATMQDQTLDLRPREFANDNLHSTDRPRFLERHATSGLDPDRTFEKDTSLCKLKGFRMVFEHGMVLIGSREDLEERVSMPDADESSPIQIRDTLKRLQGR